MDKKAFVAGFFGGMAARLGCGRVLMIPVLAIWWFFGLAFTFTAFKDGNIIGGLIGLVMLAPAFLITRALFFRSRQRVGYNSY